MDKKFSSYLCLLHQLTGELPYFGRSNRLIYLTAILLGVVIHVSVLFQKREFGIVYETMLINFVERFGLVKICYNIRVKLKAICH